MTDHEQPEATTAAASAMSASAAQQQPVVHPDGSSVQSPVDDGGNWSLDPTTTAVLVVDVQRLFTDVAGAPIAPPLQEVLPRVGGFLELARRARATVVLVRTIIARDAHSRSTLQWPEFMRAGMLPGARGTEFDPCLNRQPGDIEVVKQRYSAFVGTRLDEILGERGIESVVVLGLTTNVCVQSTARDAWQRDYQTVTLADCCAEIGEGSHDASLAWTSRNFGMVCTSHEISTRLLVRPDRGQQRVQRDQRLGSRLNMRAGPRSGS